MVVEGAKMAVTGVTPVTPSILSAKNFVVRAVLCIFAENYARTISCLAEKLRKG